MKIFSKNDFWLFFKYFFGYLFLVFPIVFAIFNGRAALAEFSWQLKDKADSLIFAPLAENATTSREFENLPSAPLPQISSDPTPTGQPNLDQEFESYVWIPKIKVKAKIVFPDTNDSKKLLDWLEKGVIHYPDSAGFGNPSVGRGVAILLGHSSAYPWYRGNYGSVFALLEKLKLGDEVIVVSDGQKHLYRVSGSEVVVPRDFKVENPDGKAHLWLMSCWPVRTNKLRMVVSTDLIRSEAL